MLSNGGREARSNDEADTDDVGYKLEERVRHC